MDKKEMQKIWDKTLVEYAFYNQKMVTVMAKFFTEIGEFDDNKEPYWAKKEPDWLIMFDRLLDLKLNRCLDITKEKELICNFGTNSSMQFIYAHSRGLAGAIAKTKVGIKSDTNPKHYKWRKLLITDYQKNKSAKISRLKAGVGVYVNSCIVMRELSHKHDWNIVK